MDIKRLGIPILCIYLITGIFQAALAAEDVEQLLRRHIGEERVSLGLADNEQMAALALRAGEISISGLDSPGDCFLEPHITYVTNPVFGLPAFWLRGDLVKVTVDPTGNGRRSMPGFTENWEVWLEKSNGAVQCSMPLSIEDVLFLDPVYEITVIVPESVPEDLFDIHMSADFDFENVRDMQPNAVKVIAEFKTDFRFVHITDVHVDDLRGYLNNARESFGYKYLHKAISEINLLDPDFVLISGDLMFGRRYWYEFVHCWKQLQGFDAPLFMGIGNHDGINHDWLLGLEPIDGHEAFEDAFGPRTYSFDYGDCHFVSVNSHDWGKIVRAGIGWLTLFWLGQIRDGQLQWIDEDLAASSDASLKVVYLHHPPHESFQGTGAEELKNLVDLYEVDLVLAGHKHKDDIHWEGDTPYVQTSCLEHAVDTPLCYPAFRLVEVVNNEIANYNYEEPRFSIPIYRDSRELPPNELRDPSIGIAFDPANNGENSEVTATIENTLLMPLSPARLEFYMPALPPDEGYIVEGGTIIWVEEAGDREIWYVETEVDPESTRLVRIYPEDEPSRF